MERKIRTVLTGVILALCITTALSQQIIVPKVKGTSYGYLEHRPACATKLLISLHGWGERGNGTTELQRVANVGAAKRIKLGTWKRTEFVVISPQLPIEQKMFSPRTLHSFILQMCKKHAIDTTEVYLIGLSGGANSIYSYLTAGKNWSVKAAVTIAGAGAYKFACNATPYRLWAFHGNKDTTVSYTSAMMFINNYNKCSPPERAQIHTYEGYAHSTYVWETTYNNENVYQWMLGLPLL